MQVPLVEAGCFADHVGVAWMLRTVGGRRLVGHGGLTSGYGTAFTLAPDAQAAVVVLTNATPGGTWLARSLTRTILRETVGVDDVPPRPTAGLAGDTTAYVGHFDNPFAVQEVRRSTKPGEIVLRHEARAPRAGRWAPPPPPAIRLGFHAPDRVVALAPPMLAGLCGEFGRDAAGRVAWLRWGGRLAPRLEG
jgi:hypothetical protein